MINEKLVNSVLRCPVCKERMVLSHDQKSVVCENTKKHHLFDFSSSGYINLFPSRPAGGDSAECVAARHAFLEKDYYLKVSEAINELLLKYVDGGNIVDAGSGEGYYTINMAKNNKYFVYGFDLSKSGVTIAAKNAKKKNRENVLFGVASIFSLPVSDGAASAVTNIFAPCSEEEFARVLNDNGILILAGAGKEHLIDLKRAVYDSAYENEGRRDLPKEKFRLLEKKTVSFGMELESGDDIMSLFSMTPYYYRTSEKDMKKLESLSSLYTKAEVELLVYCKTKKY